MRFGMVQRLVILFLCCGLLPSVAGAVGAAFAAGGVERAFMTRFQATASNISDKVDRGLAERYSDAQAFAGNRVVSDTKSWYQPDPKANAIASAMDRYVGLYKIYYLTILVDTTGKVVAVNSKDASGRAIATGALYKKSFAEAAWFKALVANRTTSRQPYSSPENSNASGTYVEDARVDEDVAAAYGKSGLRSIGFSAPVYADDGKVIGYWSNRASFAFVEQIAVDYAKALKQSGYTGAAVSVLNGDGNTLIDYDPHSRGTEDLAPAEAQSAQDKSDPIVLEVLGGKSGLSGAAPRHGKADDLDVAGYFRERGAQGFPGMNWSFIVRVPRSEALGPLRVQDEIGWAVRIGALLVVAIAGFILARRFARPLVDMARVAGAIATGDLDQKVTHHSKDESGELANALRSLVEYIVGVAKGSEAMARGDLSVDIVPRSTKDTLSASVVGVKESLQRLTGEVKQVIDAARAGQLSTRGDARAFEGAYREVVSGINDVMHAFDAPIREAKSVLEEVSRRNLSKRMVGKYQGDYAAVKDSLNQALDNLDGTLSSVSDAADQVALASTEIATGNQSLSHAAVDQASSLEEVKTKLQDITTVSTRNAASAQQARDLAERAFRGAERGVESVRQLSAAVSAIKNHADQTAKIVKTIDEIAFQTNLLALNAAVEAARSGDAGKGFAVVAEEVRNLAMRSAEAAKTTAGIIEESMKSSALGVRINGEVSVNFDEIAANVRNVVEVMSEIAGASETQSRGVGQVSTAVEEMSRATQQNAATTEESAAAAEELSAQATSVQALVNEFALTTSHASKAARGPAPRRLQAVPSHRRNEKGPPPLPPTGTDDSGTFPLGSMDF
jgi:methyl-accepting chemotaxis protein